jgi:glycosyltransferase involved in cell wall biosynthesis
MRILLAHNFYKQPGGEDVVFNNEGELLRTGGHVVEKLIVASDGITGPWTKIRVAVQTAYSAEGGKLMAQILRSFRPDVVHIHNFFPLLTPAVYDACQAAGVPVVQTLHNYRLLCASAHLYRNARPCEDCIGASPYQAVLHSCYRGSRVGSMAVARMIDFHRRHDTWNTRVDRFIALTEFARSRFLAAGIRAERMTVKPNFVPDPGLPDEMADIRRTGALFVGRLSPEKGIAILLAAWQRLQEPLVIAGDGPMRLEVERIAGQGVEYRGHLSAHAAQQAMRAAAFLIMPSEWYETFGMVIAEAYANSLPVIASRLGAMAELIEDCVTGLHFTAGDANDLAQKVEWAAAHPQEMRAMGRRARQVYETKYTPEVNYRRLIAIYEAVTRNK